MRSIRGWFRTPATQGQFVILAVTMVVVIAFTFQYLYARAATRNKQIGKLDSAICTLLNHSDTHPTVDPPSIVTFRDQIDCPAPRVVVK